MRQTATTEKIDPLTRIQEEIREVVRREQEYRQLSTTVTSPTSEYDDNDNDYNGNTDISHHENDSSNNNSLSISPVPTPVAVAAVTSLVVMQEDNASNTPSLASSVNSKESLDEQHSDDSGISASSSPVNGTSANNNNNDELKIPVTAAAGAREQRYIGPNCYNMTPEPPQQKLMTRTVSTPHLAATKPRQFAFSPSHKGVMQRFIASRGKLQLNNNNNGVASNKIMLNSKSAMALSNSVAATSAGATPPNTPMTAGAINTAIIPDFGARNPTSINIPAVSMAQSAIERDSEGRPIRPGYVPVELKIQRELKDIKSRETELKKIRKIRQSTPDLLNSIDNENVETDDDDSEVEHCYGPGKLRTAKSISELCESSQSNNSISPRETPSPDFDLKLNFSRGNGGLRPAMSLAQLCDLTPEEAPSSHRLIAQWESLIQQHA